MITTGRGVTEGYARASYETLKQVIPKYLSLDCDIVNGSIFLYDNDTQIKLIYSTQCMDGVKKISCILDECTLPNKGYSGGIKYLKKRTKRRTKRRKRSKMRR